MGLYREEVKAKTLTAYKKARDEDGKRRKWDFESCWLHRNDKQSHIPREIVFDVYVLTLPSKLDLLIYFV